MDQTFGYDLLACNLRIDCLVHYNQLKLIFITTILELPNPNQSIVHPCNTCDSSVVILKLPNHSALSANWVTDWLIEWPSNLAHFLQIIWKSDCSIKLIEFWSSNTGIQSLFSILFHSQFKEESWFFRNYCILGPVKIGNWIRSL